MMKGFRFLFATLLAISSLILVSSCEKNDPPSPYKRVYMSQVNQGEKVSGCTYNLAAYDSNTWTGEFSVLYNGLQVAKSQYIDQRTDIDVTVGEVNGGTVILVIGRPHFCSKVITCYQGEVKVDSFAIYNENNKYTDVYCTPAVFYAPGEIRLSWSTNPRAEPRKIISVPF